MRISDWSSDVCSSDLFQRVDLPGADREILVFQIGTRIPQLAADLDRAGVIFAEQCGAQRQQLIVLRRGRAELAVNPLNAGAKAARQRKIIRSEEHTSELQSLMRISYAVFCLQKKK